MRTLQNIAILVMASLATSAHGARQSADEAAVSSGIDAYVRSIDAADLHQAASIFRTSPDTIFIHPRGTERGWDAIATDFYGKTMGDSFTKRSLHLSGTPHIHVYGTAAVAEFEWKFDAIRRDNGQPLHTEGRESQTWVKGARGDWRIVAIHYSGLPQTGAGRGF